MKNSVILQIKEKLGDFIIKLFFINWNTPKNYFISFLTTHKDNKVKYFVKHDFSHFKNKFLEQFILNMNLNTF